MRTGKSIYKIIGCMLMLAACLPCNTWAQGKAVDTMAIARLVKLADSLAVTEPGRALAFYQQADSLVKIGGHEAFIKRMLRYYSWSLNNAGRFTESLDICNRALAIAQKNKDSAGIGSAYSAIGLVYVNMSFYQLALENYLRAMTIMQAVKDTERICYLYSAISGCYYPLKLYDKSLEYEQRSLSCLTGTGDSDRTRNSYFNLALVLKELGRYEEAYQYYQRTAELNKFSPNKILDCRIQYALAALMNVQYKYKEAMQYAQAGINLSAALHFESGQSMCMTEKGKALMQLRRFTEARQNLQQACALAKQGGLGEELQAALDPIRFVEAALGNFDASMAYDRQYRRLIDSVFNQQSSNNIQELESKYEAARKQDEINKLQSEKKIQELSLQRKSIVNAILIGGAVTSLIIFVLFYRNYRQKQKLQQQRINELETEKKLAATEAVLKGEEQERTRLAKDLHDGLGGMLSGIKYSLNTMAGNLVMTTENAQAFERNMDMLDSSIKEMRRVAHNMMPEALVKFGLDTALKDFCSDINKSGALKVTYQSLGMEQVAVEQTAAITIYRIVQELLNNTMKHAAATHAIVQLSQTGGMLSVTVEDDGKGFDTGMLNISKGIGWDNIRNRVDFLKGRLDVDSQPGKGTSVHIELNTSWR